MGVPRSRVVLVLLACVAFVTVRLLCDHLHFCFDGGEPFVSVHGDDGDIHHAGAGISSPHEDVDVDLMSAVFKSASDTLMPLALLSALLLLILPQVRLRRIEFPSLLLPDSRFQHLRPPLRGPPR